MECICYYARFLTKYIVWQSPAHGGAFTLADKLRENEVQFHLTMTLRKTPTNSASVNRELPKAVLGMTLAQRIDVIEQVVQQFINRLPNAVKAKLAA
jgi:hypothetical protein